MQQNNIKSMMKMDPENKNSKMKHFQIIEKKKINGQSTKGNEQQKWCK